MADNYHMEVISDSKIVFGNAVEIAFRMASYNDHPDKARYWLLKGDSLVLLLYASDSLPKDAAAHPLPFPMDFKMATDFCWEWLQNQKYPTQPDHDGSNNKGFRLTTSDTSKAHPETIMWHNPGGVYGGIVKIAPWWCMCGK